MPLRKSEIRETGEGQIEVVVEYEIRRVFHKRQGIPVMIFKDSDAIELLESAGYDKYKLTTDGVVASNSIRFPQVAVSSIHTNHYDNNDLPHHTLSPIIVVWLNSALRVSLTTKHL